MFLSSLLVALTQHELSVSKKMFFLLILITIVSIVFVVALIIYAYKYPKRKSYFFACAWVIALGGLGVGVMLIDYEKNQAKHEHGLNQKR